MIERRSILRYSEAFKLQVVREIESGKYGIPEASSVYGIKGSSAVRAWMDKYSTLAYIPKVIRVEALTKKAELKSLYRPEKS